MSGIAIVGVGAVSPVGLSAPATCAALRAGIARLGPIESFQVADAVNDPTPATGGRVPLEWLDGGPPDEEWPGHQRFAVPEPPASHLLIDDGPGRVAIMASLAAGEAWSRTGIDSLVPADFGLFLGLDEREEAAPIVDAIRRALTWRPIAVDIAALGRASALLALDRAITAIAAGRMAGALVVGADSLLRSDRLQALADAGALKDDDHPQGILPGEGAGAVVLMARPVQRLATVLGSGTAEESSAGSERPNRAEGLSAALRAARRAAPALAHRPLIACDLNGDRYRALEWNLADTRCLGDLRWGADGTDGETLWHPADCIGDSGAASGALNLVWAVEALVAGHTGHDRALVWGASDGSLRAAAILANGDT